MATDRRSSLIQLANDARLVQCGYQSAAQQLRGAADGLEIARQCEQDGESWPQSVESAQQQRVAIRDLCEQLWERVRRIATDAPLLVPDVSDTLQFVWLGADRWHEQQDFDWQSSTAELRRIENAARRAAENLGTNIDKHNAKRRRDKDATLVLFEGILLEWHAYKDKSVGNYSPASFDKIMELSKRKPRNKPLSKSTITRCFRARFGGHRQYKAACRSESLKTYLLTFAGDHVSHAVKQELVEEYAESRVSQRRRVERND